MGYRLATKKQFLGITLIACQHSITLDPHPIKRRNAHD